MITTKGLEIGYKRSLLQVTDLHLAAGVYILIGRNGSGKSTFLKTLTGEIPPLKGEITLNQKDVETISKHDLPKHIAFVPSRFPEVEFLRAEEYVALGRSPHTNYFGRMDDADRGLIQMALQQLDIEHLKDRFTNQLSDGERQLCAIARAFVQESPIIALDEPTAFLDYRNKAKLLAKLIELGKDFGKCIVLSSHDIDQSLGAECPFLVINQTDKKLELIPKGIEKQALLQRAFE